MEKLLKSFFNTSDKKKPSHEGNEEDEKTATPPMDSKRQLSISRSGRMKQANKKRHSLTLELYGDTIDIDQIKKNTPVEYHVHNPASKSTPADSSKNNRLDDLSSKEVKGPNKSKVPSEVSLEKKLNALSLASGNNKSPKSPEEEIDNAFEIIDKS